MPMIGPATRRGKGAAGESTSASCWHHCSARLPTGRPLETSILQLRHQPSPRGSNNGQLSFCLRTGSGMLPTRLHGRWPVLLGSWPRGASARLVAYPDINFCVDVQTSKHIGDARLATGSSAACEAKLRRRACPGPLSLALRR